MKSIKRISSSVVYENQWMKLREDVVDRNGEKGIYSVVEKPDFVVILPVDGDSIFVVEQDRYAIGRRTTELPQGSWEQEPDTPPIEVARAELKEEVGISASKMIYVGFQYLATGYSNQGYHIYVAKGLHYGRPNLEDVEADLISKRILIDDFEEMIYKGEIIDATSCNSFMLARMKGLI